MLRPIVRLCYHRPGDEQARARLVPQTKILQRLHEIAVEEAARIFIVHDLNPRALSPRVIGFVQARSWYQDLTPIVVTSPPN